MEPNYYKPTRDNTWHPKLKKLSSFVLLISTCLYILKFIITSVIICVLDRPKFIIYYTFVI